MSTLTAKRDDLETALVEATVRQDQLLGGLEDIDLERQVSPLMSPICWDMAHMAHYESLWLDRALTDRQSDLPADPVLHDPVLDDLYDAFTHPRAERGELDMLDAGQARDFAARVRLRTLDVLAATCDDDLAPDGARPLLRDGFVYGMVVQHAHQHLETVLATLAIMDAPLPRDPTGSSPAGLPPIGSPGTDPQPKLADEICFEASTATVGTDDEPWALDNERPSTVVTLAPYYIDTAPVTNAAYAAFVADGAYDDPRWWSEPGWKWRREAGLEHPESWVRNVGSWMIRRFGHTLALAPDEPVEHVCWYEADAYARWIGKRLPTEAEWERAARDSNATIASAVLASSPERLAPGSLSVHPVTTEGLRGPIGGVWEWTASDFVGYPGFEAFPYPEYSQVFFGNEYKVLRGGSWATHPSAIRSTFRNWDYPIRRQIFAGFRCARDADGS